MNSYRAIFLNKSEQIIKADDSDMAVIVLGGLGGLAKLVLLHKDGSDGLVLFQQDAPVAEPEQVEPVANDVPVVLPPRRARGLILTYVNDGENITLHVSRLGASASLSLASDEGVLIHDRTGDERQLSKADLRIIDQWMSHYADYVAAYKG